MQRAHPGDDRDQRRGHAADRRAGRALRRGRRQQRLHAPGRAVPGRLARRAAAHHPPWRDAGAVHARRVRLRPDRAAPPRRGHARRRALARGAGPRRDPVLGRRRPRPERPSRLLPHDVPRAVVRVRALGSRFELVAYLPRGLLRHQDYVVLRHPTAQDAPVPVPRRSAAAARERGAAGGGRAPRAAGRAGPPPAAGARGRAARKAVLRRARAAVGRG